MRVSREKAEENRERILKAAARLFRERGIDASGVDDVTRAVGLTHGGFYRHFDSKEALTAEAVERALSASAKRWRKHAEGVAAEEALGTLVARYLSREHRDSPGRGCPLSALGSEVTHQPKSVRRSFTKGLMEMLNVLEDLSPDRDAAKRRDRAMLALVNLVGAIIMARAVEDSEFSNLILTTVRNQLVADLPSTKNRVKRLSGAPSRTVSNRS
jgi:TetR/AcrR family transcriptional repressor of nem operon